MSEWVDMFTLTRLSDPVGFSVFYSHRKREVEEERDEGI